VVALKELAMSAEVDQFCDKLRDRLNAIEGRLRALATDMQGFPAQAEKTLRDKLEEARTKLEAQKDRIEQTRAQFKARIHQMMTETNHAIDEWKAKGEARRLIARADLAEAHAVDAIALALASFDEAEEAILEAIVARKDADAAQKTEGKGAGPAPVGGSGLSGRE
jgi:type I site-specific restriction endonuclease